MGLRVMNWGMETSTWGSILGAHLCSCAMLCVKANMCVLGLQLILGAHICSCAMLCVKANMCALGLHDPEGYIVFLCRAVCKSQHVCHPTDSHPTPKGPEKLRRLRTTPDTTLEYDLW